MTQIMHRYPHCSTHTPSPHACLSYTELLNRCQILAKWQHNTSKCVAKWRTFPSEVDVNFLPKNVVNFIYTMTRCTRHLEKLAYFPCISTGAAPPIFVKKKCWKYYNLQE